MVLGNLPVPGRPTNIDYNRARAYWACSRCGWGGKDIFTLIYPFSSFSLSSGDGPIWTQILSQRAVKPKTTNQHLNFNRIMPFEILSLKIVSTCHFHNNQGCIFVLHISNAV